MQQALRPFWLRYALCTVGTVGLTAGIIYFAFDLLFFHAHAKAWGFALPPAAAGIFAIALWNEKQERRAPKAAGRAR